MDVGKCDLTLNQVRRERLLGVGRFLRLVQKLKHALGGRGCLLQHIGDVGDLLDGLREAAHILDKRLNVATVMVPFSERNPPRIQMPT